MAIEVVPLTEADIPGAIEVIQEAFADDPYFKWVFDASKVGQVLTYHNHIHNNITHIPLKKQPTQFNKQRNATSLTARCLWGINNAIFHVAKDTTTSPSPSNPNSHIVGASCWLPPHHASQPESWYTWSQGLLLSWRQMLNNAWHFGRGGLRSRRYWIWKARQEEAQRAIWDDPRGYYFCNIVAVRPGCQGMGVGRRLFEAVTEVADAEGVKCYLESSRREPNVGIYERLGFGLRREMECRDPDGEGDACMLYCMVREPRGEKE